MNEIILHKINRLGGNTEAVSHDKNFVENWQAIRFNHYLYDKDWDVYGIDAFYEEHKDLYKNNSEKFYTDLLEHYFSEHERAYGQYFFRNWIFTPFKENTEDYNELDGLVDEDHVRKTVQGPEMEFICVLFSYGYPDHFFVCTTDPDQSNPTVYSTDHEIYFDEIENKGNLESFLDRFMTKEEFREVVRGYLAGKFGE
ncbi:hypothetical protein H3Z85_19285 [Chryseobacterium indologenes]|uniref:hypothetical protein n=1 Tax=Chryseobacterium indologenes TaxID=253 RepID=UPI0003E05FDC|nr:hypothetical protein [Chryseobacterium indologenes]QPQ51406.1 hypothetical protein H3Z85_19285 [Chryseobacterium indologenes]TLX26931.1 hypothetical protein FE904_04550 [Chryseobacterium indologenes]SFI90079.1 hypothetical protein SAMN05421692_0966 [Chryseobacterium indologenes]SUX49834.1 Uncharacterised protein [Chryseobacterium indologenes]GAE65277.1 hypothetical protein CIN01S_10_02950 [Chryseobacterium indologenes NBRC 14944]